MESFCGLALSFSAFAVLIRVRFAWTAASAANAFAMGGMVLGVVALAVGGGPSTDLNSIYHRVTLVALVAVLTLLVTSTARTALSGTRRTSGR